LFPQVVDLSAESIFLSPGVEFPCGRQDGVRENKKPKMNLLPRDEKFFQSFQRQVKLICQAADLLVEGLPQGTLTLRMPHIGFMCWKSRPAAFSTRFTRNSTRHSLPPSTPGTFSRFPHTSMMSERY
jgi:hypothetical protein